jgi:hypothetical protein
MEAKTVVYENQDRIARFEYRPDVVNDSETGDIVEILSTGELLVTERPDQSSDWPTYTRVMFIIGDEVQAFLNNEYPDDVFSVVTDE